MFAAAATSIKVKLYKDDGDEDTVSDSRQAPQTPTLCRQDTPQPSGSATPIDRTSTGIISNKPQKVGLSVLDTLATSKGTGISVVALAKRESARRGLYSRFFRGPVLSSDAEELPDLRVAQQPPRRCSEPNVPNRSVSITEQGKGKKRKSQEEGGEETRLSRKKRKYKKETETKEETKERRRPKLNREARKGDACEDRLDGKAESGLAKKSTAPEILVQAHDVGGRPRKKDRKKKGKRKDGEGSACHNG